MGNRLNYFMLSNLVRFDFSFVSITYYVVYIQDVNLRLFVAHLLEAGNPTCFQAKMRVNHLQEAIRMLKPKSPQTSFFMSGSYLYDRIVPIDHLLRKINQ